MNVVTPAQRKRAKKWVQKWRHRMFLGEWFLDIAYAKYSSEHSTDNYKVNAICAADPVYMRALITLYPEFWDLTKVDQESCIAHELAHCHTQSVWNCMKALHQGELVTPDQMRCEIEQLTQRITNIAFQQEWR